MRPGDSRAAGAAGQGAGRRTLIFKFKVTPAELAVIRLRARGYPNPAEYARRSLTAGWALPVERIGRVTNAFLPLQELIERVRGEGDSTAADRATDALRQILSAVGDPW